MAARSMAAAVSMRRALWLLLSGLSSEVQSVMQDLPFDGKALFAKQTDTQLHGMKDSRTTLQTLSLYVPAPSKTKFKPQQVPAPDAQPKYEAANKKKLCTVLATSRLPRGGTKGGRFHEVFKTLAESDEGKLHVLRVVYEVWKNHPQMIAVLVDKMIRTQIVDCAAVANWIFSPELAHDFTRFYIWEILHSTIRKMNKHVVKIQKELEETKARLARQHKRRDSDDEDEDDDRSSGREDGPLEEQIERLQEKVESAQSEQKNLFLVIFQHHQIIQQYMLTLENLLFTAELDHHILAVFQQFCALQA
ncbi:Nuclear cap-binding protein subunit 1-A [Chelonia mydas]|uniref:Nuclear cap-binding protein subunit 1-A n=1 Tax=Chelonia mydas TaxID=8469 RepID=M7BPB3_CHEMY|nr:Nuclear cap-binding protein subunit 1-A [Chelonia mydas]